MVRYESKLIAAPSHCVIQSLLTPPFDMSYLSYGICSTLSQRYGNSRCRIAIASSHGKRHTMEDAHFVKMQRSSRRVCIGVLDGHGGDWAAIEAASILPAEMLKRTPEEAAGAYLSTDTQLRRVVEAQSDPSVLVARRALCQELAKWERCWGRMHQRWSAYKTREEVLSAMEYGFRYRGPELSGADQFRRLSEIEYLLSSLDYDITYERPAVAFSDRKKASVAWGRMAQDQYETLQEERQAVTELIAPYKRANEIFRKHIAAYQDDCVTVCNKIHSIKEEIQKTYRQTERSGCTVAVCDVDWLSPDGMPRVTLSHAGDSRVIVYSRCGKVRYWTEDHKPEDEREGERIQAAGSTVRRHDGGVFRVNGNLNLSRAFGDFEDKWCEHRSAEEQAITCLPDVQPRLQMEPGDFIVVCCDGIFECAQFTNETLGMEIVSCKGWAADPEAAALRVLAKCAKRPTHDNQTIAIGIFGKPGDTYGTGRAVYTPMAVQNPRAAFCARPSRYYPQPCFVDVLTKELEGQGLTLRTGILRGFDLESPSNPEAEELRALVQETPDSQVAAALLARYIPSSSSSNW
jgi:serine/threonine protein phosphatase PrpC